MNGSMKKLIVIPSILSLMMIALVGCEEDNGIYGSGGSNNITLTSFANSYDSQVNATAIARIDESYRTGAREIKIKNLVNNYSNQSLNTLDKTILANNFEGRLENKNIEVNGRTVKRPIYEKNTNNKSSYEVTYKTLDLSGVKADSYLAGNTVSDSRGIITSLNHYPKIPATLAFPAGSVCYIPVVTSERAFLAFNEKDKTGYSALDKWIDAAESLGKKTIVIDDAQYIMLNDELRRSDETGFKKFVEMAKDYVDLITHITNHESNLIVYFMTHIETSEDGRMTAKTTGKMIREKVVLEGLFSIVLRCQVRDGMHFFSTKTNGLDCVKTPEDMFNSDQIENDLSLVNQAVIDYGYFN